jgi:hypothetical protein
MGMLPEISQKLEDFLEQITSILSNLMEVTMKPLKSLKGTLKNFAKLELHILLTQEDDVIVARCLDFSVSSHGENEKEALDSLSESLTDYLNYAIEKDAFDEMIDPDEEAFWQIYHKLEWQNELMTFHQMAKTLKKENLREFAYA